MGLYIASCVKLKHMNLLAQVSDIGPSRFSCELNGINFTILWNCIGSITLLNFNYCRE